MKSIMSLSSVIITIFALLSSVAVVNAYSYDYSETTAMRALTFAKISYCPSNNIRSWSCAACPLQSQFQVYRVYDNASVESQAFSGYDPAQNQIVVAFRGSSNIPNWISDLDFVFTDYAGCYKCRIHKGFFNEWLSYRNQILTDVASLVQKYPSAGIATFGHSLGAAVVQQCANDLAQRYGANRLTAYSFGTPRVGNPAYSEFVCNNTALKTIRVVNERDPVPHVPPMSFGFLHSTHEVWYPKGGNTDMQYCNDAPGHEDPKCSDSIIPYGIDDHLHYLGRSTDCNMN